MQHYNNYIQLVKQTLDKLNLEELELVKNALVKAKNSAKSIYIFGNGGSGGTASHIAGDFVKGASYKEDKKFRFICLNDNFSAIGAISNDISFDDIFSEQIKNFANQGDLVIGLSGSGNSVNIVKALEQAKSQGANTIAFSGYSGGKIKEIANLSVHIPVNDMEIAEDFHLMAFHMIKQSIIKDTSRSLDDMGSKYLDRMSKS